MLNHSDRIECHPVTMDHCKFRHVHLADVSAVVATSKASLISPKPVAYSVAHF